jgi:hypothetical protein
VLLQTLTLSPGAGGVVNLPGWVIRGKPGIPLMVIQMHRSFLSISHATRRLVRLLGTISATCRSRGRGIDG